MKERIQVGDSFILMAALVGFLDESGLAPLFFSQQHCMRWDMRWQYFFAEEHSYSFA